MTRNTEGATIVAASILAGFGVTLVNFAQDRSVDAQTALTFLVFLISFGTLYFSVRAFAPRATPLLIPPVVALVGLGFFEIYRLDPARAGLRHLRHRNQGVALTDDRQERHRYRRQPRRPVHKSRSCSPRSCSIRRLRPWEARR